MPRIGSDGYPPASVTDEATTLPVRDETPRLQLRLHTRVRHGMRRSANWFQLVRFSLVGASGYAVNLATYALCLHALGVHYRVSAVLAFLVALTNNFWWNRHWTFDAGHGHAGFQAARFLVVSVAAFLFSFVVLQLLVELGHVDKVVAQAVAIGAATPLNFLGNKLWSFRA
jgi:putative flippase GtrA